MSNKTMRFFFPLKIVSHSHYDCSEEDREEISPKEAVLYEDQILAAVVKENCHFENERGLAEYLSADALKEKVRSLHPSVEVWNGKLWGVMTAHINSELTPEEMAQLLLQVEGQNSDGWGAGFEQSPIKTTKGKIYVSFWNSDREYFIIPEQDLKQTTHGLSYGNQTMGGL